jgi:hypothetical protein
VPSQYLSNHCHGLLYGVFYTTPPPLKIAPLPLPPPLPLWCEDILSLSRPQCTCHLRLVWLPPVPGCGRQDVWQRCGSGPRSRKLLPGPENHALCLHTTVASNHALPANRETPPPKMTPRPPHQFHLAFYMGRPLPNTFALGLMLHVYSYWLSDRAAPMIWLLGKRDRHRQTDRTPPVPPPALIHSWVGGCPPPPPPRTRRCPPITLADCQLSDAATCACPTCLHSVCTRPPGPPPPPPAPPPPPPLDPPSLQHFGLPL